MLFEFAEHALDLIAILIAPMVGLDQPFRVRSGWDYRRNAEHERFPRKRSLS